MNATSRSQDVYLVGHSAGATHVASYAFVQSRHPSAGPGVSGIVLLSGRYRVDARPDDPRSKSVQAYSGTDAARYHERSPLTFVQDAPRVPMFIVIAEFDNPGLDTQGALLRRGVRSRAPGAVCARGPHVLSVCARPRPSRASVAISRRGRRSRRWLTAPRLDRSRNGLRHRAGDVVLYPQHAVPRPVVGFRPDHLAALGSNQPDRDPHRRA